MWMFYAFFLFIVGQRLVELFIARRNEKWMKGQGALEFGKEHYRYIVCMHSLFFLSLLMEVFLLGNQLSPFWKVLFLIFITTQIIRIWALTSLGKYWNTKIIVLPNANIIRRGPYRFIKHPNYIIVAIELVVIPLLFDAYITAALFTLLNILVLSIRIPAEEKALKQLTEYEIDFDRCNRFIPKLLK
jgi:methyltransferase